MASININSKRLIYGKYLLGLTTCFIFRFDRKKETNDLDQIKNLTYFVFSFDSIKDYQERNLTSINTSTDSYFLIIDQSNTMQYLILLVLCSTFSLTFGKALSPVKCGPVCDIYCPFGNVFDDKGCPTCRCKKSPCDDEATPLQGYFCGRGVNRRDCPSTHTCKISPVDAYAVCCPRAEPAVLVETRAIQKVGSCPAPSGMIGICIARCSTDNNCPGDQKCCGSCPRTCVAPVL